MGDLLLGVTYWGLFVMLKKDPFLCLGQQQQRQPTKQRTKNHDYPYTKWPELNYLKRYCLAHIKGNFGHFIQDVEIFRK